MLGRLRSSGLLAGFRGAEPTNLQRLADVIVRIAEFASDQRDVLAELDVNPLLCAGDQIIAVDALIVQRARLTSN